MHHFTYEKQLIKAYDKTQLYQILPSHIAITLINTYRHYQRGITVKQVISVLSKELVKSQWNYDSIQLALNETQPKGTRHDA